MLEDFDLTDNERFKLKHIIKSTKAQRIIIDGQLIIIKHAEEQDEKNDNRT